jgi:hypothetical protein
MPIDSSVLLQATQPQLPNPLDMATKALTLRNLATSNAMNQYQLQSVQDLPAAMQLASRSKLKDSGPAQFRQSCRFSNDALWRHSKRKSARTATGL